MPLTDDALTLTVLGEIRDELRTTRGDLGARIDGLRLDLGGRIDELGARVDLTNDRLSHVEAALVELAQQQAFVVRWLKAGSRRDRRLDADLVKLEKRVEAIEARLPATEE